MLWNACRVFDYLAQNDPRIKREGHLTLLDMKTSRSNSKCTTGSDCPQSAESDESENNSMFATNKAPAGPAIAAAPEE